MRCRPAGLAWMLALVLAAPAWGEEQLTLDEYRQALGTIEHLLRTEQWPLAAEHAERLLAARVRIDGGTLATDAWVLEPVLAVEDAAQARFAARELAVLAKALEAAGAGSLDSAAPDPERLTRLAAAQHVAGPEAGGEVSFPEIDPPSFWESIFERLAAFGEWLERQLDKLREWLRRNARQERGEGTAFDTRLVVILVALAALALALLILRRRRAGEAVPELEHGEPLVAGTASDADPLSREQDEWQRYARELETQGRLREAIRAWYHAVLMALYRQGLLQYRKGRTNWEHVAALSPALAWRPSFIALTRVFESEWYGRAASSSAALERAQTEARSVLAGSNAEREAA